jgi:hypothetical protein
MNAINTIISIASAGSTEQIEEAIVQLGGGDLDKNEQITRAALIEVFAKRNGAEAADALMDRIGL